MKHLLLFIMCCNFFLANTQTISKANEAIILVQLTTELGVPMPNEEIIIIGKKSKRNYTALTNEIGTTTTNVLVGDDYEVKVKTMLDTTLVGVVNIATPKENSFYNAPFTVNITYEPPKEYIFKNMEFDFGKFEISKKSYFELNQLLAYLNHKKSLKIKIEGHTDNVGNEKDNLILSQKRAMAIKQYLVGKGVVETRIDTQGFGATKPINENTTPEGRTTNRRIEVVFL
jgi:outer membrane protein OmpA-like peptidoglycan-associated protein